MNAAACRPLSTRGAPAPGHLMVALWIVQPGVRSKSFVAAPDDWAGMMTATAARKHTNSAGARREANIRSAYWLTPKMKGAGP